MTELDHKRIEAPCWAVACQTPRLRAALDRQAFRDWRVIDDQGKIGPTSDLSIVRGHPHAWLLVSLDDTAIYDFLRDPKALLQWTVRADALPVVSLLLLTIGTGSDRRVAGFALSAAFMLAAPEIPRGRAGLVADVIAHVRSLRGNLVEINTPSALIGGVPLLLSQGRVAGYRAGPVDPTIDGRARVDEAARASAILPKIVAYCHSNEYYGHGSVIRAYCDVESHIPIRGRVQHGWMACVADAAGAYTDPNMLIAPTYVWSRRVARQLVRSAPEVRVIGSPYLYLPPDPDPGPIGAGLLIAPGHSLNSGKVRGSWRAAASSFRTFADQRSFSFATALLHWHDREGEARNAFAEVGIESVWAGDPASTNFLHKLRYYLRAHAAVVSNRLSTVLFYALTEGREAYLAGPPAVLDDPDIEDEYVTNPAWIADQYPGILAGGRAGAGEAASEVGVEEKKSPKDLRDCAFGWLYAREAA